MRPAHVVEILTPKKFVLNGLWFGPKKPKRLVIWVHGLTSSMFSKLSIMEVIVDAETAVIAFNNRGHDNVARLSSLTAKRVIAGAAMERFEDCVDDIQGAIDFARKSGSREIYLAGHSTGCQKIAYWALKKNGRHVKGLVLLAPMSDYAGALKKYGAPKLRSMVATAKAMIKSGKGADFVRSKFWSDEPNTPARFISLYTPDSIEQSIFSYFDPARPAKTLSAMRLPLLVILADGDEYADRPARDILTWFETHARTSLKSVLVKKTGHSFKGKEREVAQAITQWISAKK